MTTNLTVTGSTVTVTDDGSTVVVTASSTGPQGATGEGVPAGGTARQALLKIDGTDYNTEFDTVETADVNGLDSALAGKVADAVLVGYTQNDAAAIDTIPRWALTTSVAPVSASIQFMQFTAPWNLTCTQISMQSAATASSGLTLARMGLFTVSGDDYTLVAQTASDTTLFNSQNAMFTRSWDTAGGFPSSYALVEGTRYAIGVIVIGTTMPTLISGPVTGLSAAYALAPRITTAVSAQSDLGNQTALTNASTRNYWARLS